MYVIVGNSGDFLNIALVGAVIACCLSVHCFAYCCYTSYSELPEDGSVQPKHVALCVCGRLQFNAKLTQ